MKLFISWSKDTSHAVALALHEWLPYVVPSVDPWVSSEDIAKGARGRDAIVKELAGTGQGVICLTRENVREPWLNFEAGALSNHSSTPRVRTVLFDLKPSDVVGPLSDFQHTDLNNEQDVFKLVHSINEASDQKLSDKQLAAYFERFWPDLVKALGEIRANQSKLPIGQDGAAPRNRDQLMEEVLERVRMLDRRESFLLSRLGDIDKRVTSIAESMGVSRDPRVGRFVAIPDIGVGRVQDVRNGEIHVNLLDDQADTSVVIPERVADQFPMSMSRAKASARYREMQDAELRERHFDKDRSGDSGSTGEDVQQDGPDL